MHRLFTDRLPKIVAVEQIDGAPEPETPRAVLDLEIGVVRRLADGVEVSVDAAQDPTTPGLVTVDDSGDRALVMACRSAHGDAQLVLVDFAARTQRVLRAFDGPGWVAGGLSGPTIVTAAQTLGATPRFRVFADDRVVQELAGTQPLCAPVTIAPDVVALLLCLEPDPFTFSGPTALCTVHLRSGAVRQLAPAAGHAIRVLDDGATLEVLARRHRTRVRLAQPR